MHLPVEQPPGEMLEEFESFNLTTISEKESFNNVERNSCKESSLNINFSGGKSSPKALLRISKGG